MRVECAASAADGCPEPASLWFGQRRVEVLSVVDRWYGTDRRWWKVETAEGFYVVRRDEVSGTWELAAVVGE
jgi:hypothetical protein